MTAFTYFRKRPLLCEILMILDGNVSGYSLNLVNHSLSSESTVLLSSRGLTEDERVFDSCLDVKQGCVVDKAPMAITARRIIAASERA